MGSNILACGEAGVNISMKIEEKLQSLMPKTDEQSVLMSEIGGQQRISYKVLLFDAVEDVLRRASTNPHFHAFLTSIKTVGEYRRGMAGDPVNQMDYIMENDDVKTQFIHFIEKYEAQDNDIIAAVAGAGWGITLAVLALSKERLLPQNCKYSWSVIPQLCERHSQYRRGDAIRRTFPAMKEYLKDNILNSMFLIDNDLLVLAKSVTEGKIERSKAIELIQETYKSINGQDQAALDSALTTMESICPYKPSDANDLIANVFLPQFLMLGTVKDLSISKSLDSTADSRDRERAFRGSCWIPYIMLEELKEVEQLDQNKLLPLAPMTSEMEPKRVNLFLSTSEISKASRFSTRLSKLGVDVTIYSIPKAAKLNSVIFVAIEKPETYLQLKSDLLTPGDASD